MKLYAILSCAALLLYACSKPDNTNDTSGNNDNTIPPQTTVNTIVTAYIETNNQTTNPVSLYINNTPVSWNLGSYSTNTVTTFNKYDATFMVDNLSTFTDYFDNSRNVPLTASSRNYIDVNNFRKEWIGTTTYAYNGGEWQLPGGGKITYGPYSFGNYSGSGSGGTYFAFLDPGAKAFSITNPSFYLDKDQKRWYLKSFGVIELYTHYPIAATGNVWIEFPIPASLQSMAPDSIPAFYFNDADKWVPKGHAKKIGNNYRQKLDAAGTWNFAVPVKGFYKTIKVRTDADLPVTNAIVRIKNSLGEVGSARTDVDGNAICFLPANESLTVEIPHGWNDITYPPLAFVSQLAPFNNSSDISLTLPTTSPYVASIRGNAIVCNGGPIQSGTVTITNRNGFIQSHLPIVNGTYKAAIIRPVTNEPFRVKAFNSATGATGTDTVAALKTGAENVINLSTCQSSTNLFVNYSIDGTNYSITGDGNQPFNPPLTAYCSSETLISCAANTSGAGNGLQFYTAVTNTGSYNGAGVSGLFVNGVYYEYDFSKPTNITFTRYDLLPGGYIEGSINLYCKRSGGASRHLIANFRVKRIT